MDSNRCTLSQNLKHRRKPLLWTKKCDGWTPVSFSRIKPSSPIRQKFTRQVSHFRKKDQRPIAMSLDFHDHHGHTFCYLCSINQHDHERTQPRDPSRVNWRADEVASVWFASFRDESLSPTTIRKRWKLVQHHWIISCQTHRQQI